MVLSLYGIPDKYIEVLSAMYENNTAAIKVGNEVSSWFCIKSKVMQGCVISPFIWIILKDFVFSSTRKGNGIPRNQTSEEKLLHLLRLC